MAIHSISIALDQHISIEVLKLFQIGSLVSSCGASDRREALHFYTNLETTTFVISLTTQLKAE